MLYLGVGTFLLVVMRISKMFEVGEWLRLSFSKDCYAGLLIDDQGDELDEAGRSVRDTNKSAIRMT
jgi:hypothetical protein